MNLPSKRQFPDYYKVTKMPIALDTIETKLKDHEFPNLATLESYFKRMILNAKEYNQKGSLVYEDAERLRKALSNFMTKHNPAYKAIPGYTSVPTPLPGQLVGATSDKDADGEPDEEIEEQLAFNKRPTRPTISLDPSTPRSSATPALPDSRYAGVGFAGLNFQQAQEKIVEDMIREKEFQELVSCQSPPPPTYTNAVPEMNFLPLSPLLNFHQKRNTETIIKLSRGLSVLRLCNKV